MSNVWFPLIVIGIATLVPSLAGQSPAAQGGDATRFIGTWRLVETTRNGKPDPVRGLHPTGVIYYDGTGHMAAQIMPEGARPAFAGEEPTPQEAQAALRGYTAYFGTYRVDERARTVTHHREGNINPGALGDFTRRYEFLSADRVALSPMENQNRLVWERMR